MIKDAEKTKIDFTGTISLRCKAFSDVMIPRKTIKFYARGIRNEPRSKAKNFRYFKP